MMPRMPTALGRRRWSNAPGCALTVLLLLSGCGEAADRGAGPVSLTVFAAASLREAVEEVAAGYEQRHPGSTIVLSFDASSALRAQIEEGAPVDVFLSADTMDPEQLAGAGLTTGSPQPIAMNGLAIVVPDRPGAAVAAWQDLAAPGVSVVAAGREVPITRYAETLIERLAGRPDAPAGFLDAVHGNVVSREDNVRAVLAKVALNEGDAGIVYTTDARSSEQVRVVPLPAGVDVPVTYAGVALRAAPHPLQAADFLQFLRSPDGQAVLRRHGFGPPP